MVIEVRDDTATKMLGEKLGRLLKGGEIIELVGDVGAGKTTFAKGLAKGLGVTENVQSPSFTINQLYDARDGLRLAHYDFYRLSDPGIMADELAENVNDPRTVTVVEWADIVEGVLPASRFTIGFTAPSDTVRRLDITGNKQVVERL